MALKGKHLIIKMGGTAIAAAKSCDINIQAEEIETAIPSTGVWRTAKPGRKAWSVNCGTLVTSLSRSVQMVGTTVSLEVSLSPESGKQFNGFVNNVTIQSGGYLGTPSQIFWDKTLKKFVGYINPTAGVNLYFDSWTGSDYYTSPSAYNVFSYNGIAYTWLANDLTAEKLTGNANVLQWAAQGTVGALMTGSFSFNGTGAITPATIP